jgi:hypothetical protein
MGENIEDASPESVDLAIVTCEKEHWRYLHVAGGLSRQLQQQLDDVGYRQVHQGNEPDRRILPGEPESGLSHGRREVYEREPVDALILICFDRGNAIP